MRSVSALLVVLLIGCRGVPMPVSTVELGEALRAPDVQTLRAADSMRVLRLDPHSNHEAMREAKSEAEIHALLAEAHGFHTFEVKSEARVTSAPARARIAALLEQAARGHTHDEVMFCFSPRHAVSVVHAGRRVDFVVCFQCHQMYVYAPEGRSAVPIGTDVATELDALFGAAGAH